MPVPGEPDSYLLEFEADCTAPTTISVHYATVEIETPGQGLAFVPQRPELPPSPPPATLPPGASQRYRADPDFPLSAAAFARHLHYSPHCPTLYPLVVALATDTPEDGRQVHYTYLEVVPTAPGAGASHDDAPPDAEADAAPGPAHARHAARVVRQKFEVRGTVFEIEEIYGMGAAGGAEDAAGAGDVDGDTCVICITNERDTTVMPCRHMCLCSDCAEQLRTQTNKCPICRAHIERLVTIHRHAATPSPPPAEPPAIAPPE